MDSPTLAVVKPYRASIDFHLAAESLKEAAELQARLFQAAERLGIYYQFASTDEMNSTEVEAGSPLAAALEEANATGSPSRA